MLRSRVGLAMVVLLASVGTAKAATIVAAPVTAVEVKVGSAASIGLVSFTLVTSVNGDHVNVQAVVDQAPLDASQKAAVVIAAVAATDSRWRGAAATGILTFQHLINGVWANVDVVSNFNDTTGAGTKLTAEDTAVAFTLAMDESAVAFGYDAMGDPSFITVSVTDTLTWTKSLQGGETPKDLLDAFQVFLAGEAGPGVTVVRLSPSSLTVVLHYDQSHVNWQVTDLGLQSSSTGEAVRLTDQATLIRRTR